MAARTVNRTRQRASVVIVALFVSLGGAELALRLLGLPKTSFAFLGQLETELYEPDQHMFWRLRADSPGFVVNRLGLRGWLPERAKGPADLRLCCVGDSCTFGLHLEYEEAYGVLLETLLQDELPHHCVETSLFAMPGFSTYQNRVLLEQHIGSLRPDLTIFYCPVWNDFVAAVGIDDAARGRLPDSGAFGERGLRLTRLIRRIVDRQAFPTMTTEEYKRRFQAGEAPAGRRVPLELFRTNMLAMFQAARAAGSELLVVLPAWPPSTVAEFPICREYRQALVDLAKAEAVVTIDPDLALQAVGANAFLDWVHPSALGNRVLAHELLPAARQALAARIQPAREAPLEPQLLAVTPDQFAAYEAVNLQIRGRGLGEPGAFDRLWIGGRWLHDLTLDSKDSITVKLTTLLPPGKHLLELRTPRGQIRSGLSVEIEPLELTAEITQTQGGHELCAQVQGPEGASVVVWLAAAARETPQPTSAGPFWLAPDPAEPVNPDPEAFEFGQLTLPRLEGQIASNRHVVLRHPANGVAQGQTVFLQGLVAVPGQKLVPAVTRLARCVVPR